MGTGLGEAKTCLTVIVQGATLYTIAPTFAIILPSTICKQNPSQIKTKQINFKILEKRLKLLTPTISYTYLTRGILIEKSFEF